MEEDLLGRRRRAGVVRVPRVSGWLFGPTQRWPESSAQRGLRDWQGSPHVGAGSRVGWRARVNGSQGEKPAQLGGFSFLFFIYFPVSIFCFIVNYEFKLYSNLISKPCEVIQIIPSMNAKVEYLFISLS
jgi:hypothetical protein